MSHTGASITNAISECLGILFQLLVPSVTFVAPFLSSGLPLQKNGVPAVTIETRIYGRVFLCGNVMAWSTNLIHTNGRQFNAEL